MAGPLFWNVPPEEFDDHIALLHSYVLGLPEEQHTHLVELCKRMGRKNMSWRDGFTLENFFKLKRSALWVVDRLTVSYGRKDRPPPPNQQPISATYPPQPRPVVSPVKVRRIPDEDQIVGSRSRRGGLHDPSLLPLPLIALGERPSSPSGSSQSSSGIGGRKSQKEAEKREPASTKRKSCNAVSSGPPAKRPSPPMGQTLMEEPEGLAPVPSTSRSCDAGSSQPLPKKTSPPAMNRQTKPVLRKTVPTVQRTSAKAEGESFRDALLRGKEQLANRIARIEAEKRLQEVEWDL